MFKNKKLTNKLFALLLAFITILAMASSERQEQSVNAQAQSEIVSN